VCVSFGCLPDTATQLRESSFSDWFAFDTHFYVMDCRLSRDREMDRLKTTLIACHMALSLRPAAVPKICSTLLDKLEGLRTRHRGDPIVTVEELLQTGVAFPISLTMVCDSICR
jgi:hypothetical protein